MRESAAVVRFGIAALAFLGGCANVLGFDDFVAGTKVSSSPENEGGVDTAPDGAVEAEWYVSVQGDDSNDGSLQHPLRSLARAHLLASSALARQSPQRIAVCAGEYVEPSLEFRGAIQLMGGYDCIDWVRPVFDPAHVGVTYESATTLEDSEFSQAFIVLDGTTLGTPRMNGFRVHTDLASSGVIVVGAAEVEELTVVNDALPASETSLATVAFAFSNSTATVERCSFVTRQHYQVAPGAIGSGIVVAGGSPSIRRSHVLVDSVSGTCGVILARDAKLELRENVVIATNCVSPDDGAASAAGFMSNDCDVTSVRNSFQFDLIGNSNPAANPVSAGINVVRTSLSSDGDRIVAPALERVGDNTKPFIFYGVQGRGAISRIVNASILVDSKKLQFERSAGIYVEQPSSALIAHNSIFLSGASSAPAPGDVPIRSIWLPDAPDAATPGTVTIASNLVVSDDPRMLMLRSSCTAPGIAQLTNNRYAGFDAVIGGSGCASGAIETLWPNAQADGNARFTCPTGLRGCGDLFSEGASGLAVVRDGLLLSPATACSLGLAVPTLAEVANDATGRPRNATTTTVGAFEMNCN